MSAKRLYEAGYTDLVSVVPPKAKLAPTTTLKPEARGKVPGRQRIDGSWVGYPWLDADPPTPADIAQWESWGANVGLRADHFPGLDVDVEHPQLARLVVQEAVRHFGRAPLRTSREPRRLLVYRTEEPFERISASIKFSGVKHGVEMLGRGRQYLVHGGHPSGSDYGWQGQPLWEHDPDSLQTVTSAQVLDFFTHIQNMLSGRAEVTVQGTGEVKEKTAPPQEHLEAPSLTDLRSLVAEIPNDYPDRDSYIQIGHAIKAAGGEEAFDVFMEWAERWSGGTNEPETVESDWRRMHPPFRVGWGYLQDLAAEHGTYDPVLDAFEADPIMSHDANDNQPREVDSSPGNVEGLTEYTDTWVVEQLARRLAPRVRYVPDTGLWHVWDNHAWAQDRRNLAEHLIRRELVRLSGELRQRADAMRDVDEDGAKSLFKKAYALQQRTALTKAVPELQAHPALTLTVEDFDADDWKLNTPGGIVDLRTAQVSRCDPKALASKATAVAPGGPRPELWFEFLEETTGGDEDLQRYLQRLAGYSLTGDTQEQMLAFVHGPTRSGKSTFLGTLAGILGSYHVTAPADTFAKTSNRGVPADLATMAGARLVTASETEEGRAWDTQRVKAVTGGDEISARFLYQNPFTYTPQYQIIIVGNHEPEVSGVDEAIMRRLHIVPFTHQVPEEEVDRLLPDKLEREWSGILSWAIKGCRMWLEEGLNPPAAVRRRTEQYRREEDPVGLFLEECCVMDPQGEVTRHDLFRAWQQWCHEQGEDPGSKKTLKRRFMQKQMEHGFANTRIEDGTKRRRGYKGLRLIEEGGFTV